MKLPQSAFIREVGPRDGLQNEKQFVTTEKKLEWINLLVESGLSYIEVSSFVRPDWIPQLSDSVDLFTRLRKKDGVTYAALVPNKRGLMSAFEVDADEINFFVSASETHNLKNKNASIDHSMSDIRSMITECKNNKKTTRAYISTVFGCPYEGAVDQVKVIKLANELLECGVDEISLGDTIGIANPLQVNQFLEYLVKEVPVNRIAMHFHDTYGRAVANLYTSLLFGIEKFDSSNGGLGGCPYAPGASGNVATEDVVSLLHNLGITTNVDEKKLHQATSYISEQMNLTPVSKLFSVWNGSKESI
ncbi:hydroxymethylglutaryl-CoA lyase [Gottfriedia acidiceleris]|uniref:Hydroxymethylglutaryl-CoA lyase n=1 Tax=Gottfriedia acidiceleris TaxID=371036 RepID=A0ABY4JLX7_9BACI|nr:hydroxymethylglutaryl-CoA lyase [Gottfriedia acidiceleris]UPM54085.1 hydroxymethylglutaryl-CoA lyase [Gottfriedia acidiceleris]